MTEDLLAPISTDKLDVNLVNWIEKQAKKYELNYLLAHAEDGVIWGQFENNLLMTSNQAFPDQKLPKLRLETLQQCRIFGEKREILLWCQNTNWKARLIDEKRDFDYIPEEQILWGTQGEEKEGFTLLSDGSEGLKHAVPLPGIEFKEKEELYRPVRLVVRHYIDYDDSGVAKIFLSRLVSFKQDTQGGK